MKAKLFPFLIIICSVLIIGCSKPKKEFSYTLETSFSLGSEYAYHEMNIMEDRIITINQAIDKGMIKVYDYQGKLLDEFGNSGNGPNELLSPFAAWYNPDGTYEVYDFIHWRRFYFGEPYKSSVQETYLITSHYQLDNKIMESSLSFETDPGFNFTINDSLIHNLNRPNWIALCKANSSFITIHETNLTEEKSVIYLYDWDGVLFKTIKFPHESINLAGTNSRYIILNFNDHYNVYNKEGELVSSFAYDSESDRFIVGMNEKYLVWYDDSGEEETMLEIYKLDEENVIK